MQAHGLAHACGCLCARLLCMGLGAQVIALGPFPGNICGLCSRRDTVLAGGGRAGGITLSHPMAFRQELLSSELQRVLPAKCHLSGSVWH